MTGNEITWCRYKFGNWEFSGDEQKDNNILYAKNMGMGYISFWNECKCKGERKHFWTIIS